MIRDSFVIGKFQELSATISKKKPKDYLQYGYGQRSLQIMESHYKLTEVINKSGGERLDPYKMTEVNILLNAFYLNMIGAIDNLAWALQHEFNLIDGANENNKKRTRVGLFNNKFQEALSQYHPEIVNRLNEFKDWFFELKDFRDPAAHRIPLHCVSGVIRDEHKNEYLEAQKHFLKQDYLINRDGYMDAQYALSQCGVFEAIFVCYSESFDKIIYPLSRTVEQDYEPFWKVSNIVHECFENGI
ncbi:hypothetical protein CXF85_08605 [Colwellia sp. 75C3]|uniref:hypothetical protein n=1 Tax=Colwellia sp. 75C3 TaxID=888425 RepID=UPI000C349DB8|nr:hypothetical protein [Colwellia sp. 75C3]PKG84374.1 hypothetical protein CXF85_08605 [Colwellia sp. 75C3]